MEDRNFGSSEAASLGGKARAESLSPSRRSEIARKAADARHGRAGVLHAIAEATLKIGNSEFECAVLADGTRVLSERAFSRAIGAKRGGSHWQRRKLNPDGANLPVFLSANNLRPFITIDLAAALSDPIIYDMESGQRANGIKAEMIPKILDVWLKARDAGVLRGQQKPFAKMAEILVRGLATTGIIALIDEATGYQDVRPNDALTKFLERYIAKEWKIYVRAFPLGFFKQLCRLKGIPFREDMKLPQYFGHLVNDLVWDRIAPGVKSELRNVNPIQDNGRRKRKHHQWLTEKIGHPKLLHHLGLLEGKASGYDDGDYDGFYKDVEKSMKKFGPIELFKDLIDENGNLITTA
jgi:P63C domain